MSFGILPGIPLEAPPRIPMQIPLGNQLGIPPGINPPEIHIEILSEVPFFFKFL